MDLFDIHIGRPYKYSGYTIAEHNSVVFPIAKTEKKEVQLNTGNLCMEDELSALPPEVTKIFKKAMECKMQLSMKITSKGKTILEEKTDNRIKITISEIYIISQYEEIIKTLEKIKDRIKNKIFYRFAEREKIRLKELIYKLEIQRKKEIQNIETINNTLTTRQKEYIKLNDQVNQLKQKEKNTDKVDIQKIKNEFDKIVQHPKIEKITYFTTNIQVDVKVDIEYNEIKYDLGYYKIMLMIDSFKIQRYKSYNIKKDHNPIANDPSDEYIHPHITRSGACLGNIGTTIYNLLENMEYTQVILLLTNYLNSYNESDPYIEIENFKRRYL